MLLNIQYLILNIHILMQYKVFCGKGNNVYAYFSAYNCENMQKDAENHKIRLNIRPKLKKALSAVLYRSRRPSRWPTTAPPSRN